MKKDITDRVADSIIIKTQLQKLGATLEETSLMQITKHMNEYVKNGVCQQFNIEINPQNIAIVTLSSIQNRKSGITLKKFHL
jgi:hypothetical protein